jgi:hypothetical protein
VVNFFDHLRSFNVSHFGMVAATALKLCCHGHLQWHDLYTEFNKNVLIGSEVGGGEGAHTQTGW